MGHLDPDLMMASGVKMDLGQGPVFIHFQDPEGELRFLCVPASLLRDPGTVCPVFPHNPVRQSDDLPRSFLRQFPGFFIRQRDDRLIDLAHIRLSGYLPAQFSSGPRRFSKNQKPFHRLVEAVYDPEIRFPLPALYPVRIPALPGSARS